MIQAKIMIQKAMEVKKKHGAKLRQYPNVTGLGVGYKEVGGKRTKTIALRVYVKKKMSKKELRREEMLPRTINGVRLDVIEKRFKIHQESEHRRFHNILVSGISVGNLGTGGSGTIGMLVFDNRGGQPLILSNWHVLCGRKNCASGELIIQPGTGGGDTGRSDQLIARLHRWVLSDKVDAAVAVLTGHRFATQELLGIGMASSYGTAELGMTVRKSGRTTGVTSGQVDDISADIEVYYDMLNENRTFREQLVISGPNVSNRGDSGSVWVDGQNRVVGLNFAGNDDGNSAMANPISAVLEALDIHMMGSSFQDGLVLSTV